MPPTPSDRSTRKSPSVRPVRSADGGGAFTLGAGAAAEITPFFNTVAGLAKLPPKLFEDVLFRGPGKVSQAVLGGADLRFEQPMDFLAVGLLHPVVLILSCVWAVGRAGGAVAGEL